MQNQNSANQRPLIRKLLLKLIAMLVLFIACTIGVMAVMHSYSLKLIATSQDELLPAIHEHQRAALNLERLERMGDLVVYGGSLALIRKNALAAQVLAFQPSFNFSEETKKTVQSAFELLREVRRTRQTLLSSQADRLSSIERENLIQLERTLQIRWGEYKQELFELQNKIISDATSLQTENMRQITSTNNLMLVVASAGVSLLLLVIIFIGFNLYKHLITPITEASSALTALEQRSGHQPLAEARYQELHTIRKAVNSLGETMSKLHDMATRDSLTGCVNRGYFMELAQQALSYAHRNRTPMALVMLDVDHFKKVNDQYGHAVGDDTLKLATKWIRAALPEDAFIGRLGGEEFALILPGHDDQQAMKLSEKIRLLIADNSTNSGTIPAITVSLGVEVVKSATDEVDKLLSQADKALYQAKASGRNQVILFQPADAVSTPVEKQASATVVKTAVKDRDSTGMHVTESGVITNFTPEELRQRAEKSA